MLRALCAVTCRGPLACTQRCERRPQQGEVTQTIISMLYQRPQENDLKETYHDKYL